MTLASGSCLKWGRGKEMIARYIFLLQNLRFKFIAS